jgi:hypothetical protein
MKPILSELLTVLLNLCLLSGFSQRVVTGSSQLTVAFDKTNQSVSFGVSRMEEALNKSGQQVRNVALDESLKVANVVIQVLPANALASIRKEGFEISYKSKVLFISAIDATGAMYGALDVAEQIRMGKSWHNLAIKKVNPYFTVRALKFNLPWSSYRVGPAMDQHLEVCRDLKFWQRFIDQMAENRFNVLSLWNVHPFSFMVKPINFPGANNFSEKEMSEWKHFWTSLFKMAKERGIEAFIVNWNIAVSPEFARKYGVRERNDTSDIVKRYTREVVTQVINEYPDLAGIGITLADWMSNFISSNSSLPQMSPKDREDWIEETVVAGIKAAKRPVKFLHRSVLSSDPQEMRRVIDNANLPDTVLVEIKFNWSHGHSTPILALTHDSHSGKKDIGYWSPLPTNYRIQWMVRNEDFFILRWGQPNFIRKHIANNAAEYVNGYFVGSEGYIPAKDISHKNSSHKTWDYAFEKQWLFYQLWGRLLYDPSTADNVFEASFNNRYGNGTGNSLLKAFSSASEMPLRLASFHSSTWDYTLYSEGFLAPFTSGGGLHDSVSSFISIDELIDHKVLDPTFISIPEFVQHTVEKKVLASGKITPLELADSLEADSKIVLNLVQQLRPGSSRTLTCELQDLETWAHVSKYFADKLRAGVALHTFRITGEMAQQRIAIQLLTNCMAVWKKIGELTSNHYDEVPYVDDHSSGGNAYKDARKFSWIKYLPQVERDVMLAQQKVTRIK